MKRFFVDLPEGQVHARSAGTGEPLLLLHQVSSSSVTFLRVMPLLASSFQVIAMDEPGFGDSFRVTEQHDIPWYTDIVVRFLDKFGIKRTHILGHHTGASMACELAAVYPERVNRLIMIGLCDLTPKEREEKLSGKSRFGTPPNDWVATQPNIDPVGDGSHLMLIWNRLGKMEPDLPPDLRNIETAEYIRNGTLAGLAKTAYYNYQAGLRLPKISCPTLCLSSDHDPELEHTRKAAEVIAGARFVCIPNPGPHIHLTKPEVFARVVEDFLKGRERPSKE